MVGTRDSPTRQCTRVLLRARGRLGLQSHRQGTRWLSSFDIRPAEGSVASKRTRQGIQTRQDSKRATSAGTLNSLLVALLLSLHISVRQSAVEFAHRRCSMSLDHCWCIDFLDRCLMTGFRFVVNAAYYDECIVCQAAHSWVGVGVTNRNAGMQEVSESLVTVIVRSAFTDLQDYGIVSAPLFLIQSLRLTISRHD